MASFNRVILIGNLTRDVRLEKTPQGTPVAEVGLAVNDRVKKNGEWVDEPTFVDVILWGRTAEIAAEYLSKGSPVMFEGRLKLDMWEKDGQKRSKMRVVAERLQLLGTRGASNANGGQTPHMSANLAANAIAANTLPDNGVAEEDIPF
jgi:single-strand DNA-binding protein